MNVAAVKDWLSSQGFDVQYVPANNHYLSAEGTVAQIESAFASLVSEGLVALVVSGENFFLTQRNLLVELAARHAVHAAAVSR